MSETLQSAVAQALAKLLAEPLARSKVRICRAGFQEGQWWELWLQIKPVSKRKQKQEAV